LWRRFVALIPDDPIATLRKLKLLSPDETSVERATVAGILLCSRHPETWLPNAYIEAVRSRGNQQDSNYRLELYSPGPLPKTVTIESLPLRQATRNELITSLLARCPAERNDRRLDANI
jgi:predicted HTH transcriptional regulator